MKTIKLPCFGIVVDLGESDKETKGAYLGGNINTELHEEAVEEDDDPTEYNAAMDGIEALILAHACAGIDIESPAYIEGIESAVQACANNL